MKAIKYITTVLISSLILFVGCSQPEFAEDNPLVDTNPPDESFSQNFQVVDQEAEAKIVDLLIVVDNSTSMAGDQEKLSREFSNFISSISDADYRIGVITTDTNTVNKENEEGYYGNLALVSSTGRRYISSDDVDPEALFAELIKRDESISCKHPDGYTLPDCVSYTEKPMLAIKMAIDKRSTVNEGFFREGADLGVVIITDEDEDAFEGEAIYTAQSLFDHFKAEFGEEKVLTAFNISIPADDPVCLQEQINETYNKNATSARPGLLVNELTVLTGGFEVNICNPNFGADLQNISRYVEKNLLPLKIRVEESIILKSIEIKITQPNGLEFSDFEYVVEGSLLKISPLPPEGSKIELGYSYRL